MRRLPFIFGSRRIVNFSKESLGNRIIPIGCTVYLARELNYRPVIFWVPLSGASFGDLFETANLPFDLVEGIEARVTYEAVRKRFPQGLNPFGKLVLKPIYLAIQIQYKNRVIRPFRGAIRDRSSFPSRSFAVKSNSFFRYRCDLSWLKPSPQINAQIIGLKKRLTPDTVGIHIRGTDKRVSGFVPPIEKMIARMRAEVELNPDVKFFIASDGDKAKEAVVTVFEDRLITPLPLSNTQRDTLGGQQGAVVDLFGLAATSRIIGFRNSSFATLAALIGNKPLLRIR